jgi:hypothetical protein
MKIKAQEYYRIEILVYSTQFRLDILAFSMDIIPGETLLFLMKYRRVNFEEREGNEIQLIQPYIISI